jgi:putative ABC transport system permease protein
VPWQQRQQELDLGVRITGGPAPRVPWVIARRQTGVALSAVEPFILSRLPAEGTANVLGRPRENVVVRPSPRVRLPLDDRGRVSVERLAMSVLAVGALVLAIGIINLIGVTIARAMVRVPEMAIRLSLGASRMRLARQMVSEALMLSVIGGLAGLGISRALVGVFLASLPARFGSGEFAVPLDWRVMGFALSASVAAGLAVGLAPVRRASRADLLTMLGASHATSAADRARLRSWIVVPQIAVCMTLLLVAGIAIKALLGVSLLDPGYRSDRVAYVSWNPDRLRPRDPSATAEQRATAWAQEQERQQRFLRELLQRAVAEPALEAVAVTDSLPTSADGRSIVRRDDYRDGSPHITVLVSRITDRYFDVMSLPLRAGRFINEADTQDSPRVAVIDDVLAARLWPEGHPIGRFIGTHSQGSTREPEWIEVVGMVGAVRHPLSEGETRPFIYLPLTQSEVGLSGRILVARSRDNTADITHTLRSIVAAADPETVVSTARTLHDAIGELRYPRRIGTALLATAALQLGLEFLS